MQLTLTRIALVDDGETYEEIRYLKLILKHTHLPDAVKHQNFITSSVHCLREQFGQQEVLIGKGKLDILKSTRLRRVVQVAVLSSCAKHTRWLKRDAGCRSLPGRNGTIVNMGSLSNRWKSRQTTTCCQQLPPRLR